MVEKREFPRIRIALPVRYETIRWSDPMRKIADARTATSRNISARGIALLYGPDIGGRILRRLDSGLLKFNLEFALPDGPTVIRTLGRLAWYRNLPNAVGEMESHLGIEFIDIPEDMFRTLQQFINQETGRQGAGDEDIFGSPLSGS